MIRRDRLRRERGWTPLPLLASAVALAGVLGWQVAAPDVAAAQAIAFETDLPRTLVFIQEEGRGNVAAREMTSFLRDPSRSRAQTTGRVGFPPRLGRVVATKADEGKVTRVAAWSVVRRDVFFASSCGCLGSSVF